ncbi:hypothetical protein D3C72_1776760 [compost metagenome]
MGSARGQFLHRAIGEHKVLNGIGSSLGDFRRCPGETMTDQGGTGLCVSILNIEAEIVLGHWPEYRWERGFNDP